MDKGLYINGVWQEGSASLTLASHNPSTHKPVYLGHEASDAQVNEAVYAAREAFKTWRDLPFTEREHVCRAFAEIVSQNKHHLVDAIGMETGKPRWDAQTEVQAMIGKIDISVRAYHERTGMRTTEAGSGSTTRQVLTHRPHGVVAVFGPYNFPAHLPNGHIVPALLAGNCAVFKPSELTPTVAQLTVQYWEQAGLPAGVLNLVQGGVAVGRVLASHPQLDGIFFTGSSQVGKLLLEQYGRQPEKILALEMGGNNALIVGKLDLARYGEAAIFTIIQSAFLSAGQRCTCARRLFIPEGQEGNHLLAQLVKVAAALQVGVWDADPQPYMGPVVSLAAARRVLEAQAHWVAQGALVLLESVSLQPGTALLSPGILDTTHVTGIPDEEVFGPLLQVIRYSSLEQAITRANATRYGLSAGLISEDRTEYEQFWRAIRAGIINWNRPTTGASSAMPFGGVGQSGNLRPSAYYAADYCSYPVASMEGEAPEYPAILPPGYLGYAG